MPEWKSPMSARELALLFIGTFVGILAVASDLLGFLPDRFQAYKPWFLVAIIILAFGYVIIRTFYSLSAELARLKQERDKYRDRLDGISDFINNRLHPVFSRDVVKVIINTTRLRRRGCQFRVTQINRSPNELEITIDKGQLDGVVKGMQFT